MLSHIQAFRSHLHRPFNRPTLAHFSSSALEWLATFTNFEQKGVPAAAGTDTDDGFDLGRMHSLLQSLNNPHTSLPAILHIAGTKGKGSTTTLLSSILSSSGYSVGSYTSPHITTLHERITVNGASIPEEVLEGLVERYGSAVQAQQTQQGGKLTHFEVLTALALKHFQEESVDVAVVETGLGGVRDATNVFGEGNLVAAVITALGNDHAAALGGSMQSIAAAKAGIMKPNRPVIIASQIYPEAEEVLIKHAKALNCPVVSVTDQLRLTSKGIQQANTDEASSVSSSGSIPTLKYRQTAQLELLSPLAQSLVPSGGENMNQEKNIQQEVQMRLLGDHQLENAGTALTAAAVAKQSGLDKITLTSALQGLEAATLPGRFQICRFTSNTSNISNTINDPVVVLDGAHTPESASALVHTFQATFGSHIPVAIVLAMADDKPHKEVCLELRALRPAAVVFTQVSVAGANTRAAAPGALVAAWQAAGIMASASSGGASSRGRRTRELIQASLVAAVEKAKMELRAHSGPGISATQEGSQEQDKGEGRKEPAGVVLVCGSLHAVGAALRSLDLTPV